MGKTLHQNQRGLGAVLVVIVVVVLAAIGAGGYFVMSKNKDSGSNANLTPEQQAASDAALDACNAKTNDKDLCKFVANSAAWDEFTMLLSSTEGSITIATKGDDSHTIFTGAAGEKMEYISLNGVTYSKMTGQETWYKYGSSTDAETDTDDYDFQFDASDIPSFTKDGKEACGSLTCFKYTFTEELEDEPGKTTTYTIWFDDKDYMPRRAAGTDEEGMSYTAEFSFDSVSISEPSPVTDFSAN